MVTVSLAHYYSKIFPDHHCGLYCLQQTNDQSLRCSSNFPSATCALSPLNAQHEWAKRLANLRSSFGVAAMPKSQFQLRQLTKLDRLPPRSLPRKELHRCYFAASPSSSYPSASLPSRRSRRSRLRAVVQTMRRDLRGAASARLL